MSNLVNHVLMNKLDDELNKAINEVGGDTSGAKGPWDYPAIIKEQLGAKGMSVDLKAGPGIVIRDFHGQKFICSTSGALTTGALNPPSGSYGQPVSDVIEAGTPVQEVFEALFYKILPKMSSVYKGDIIIADKEGSDRYNEEDERTGLIPYAHYLRIYVANRQEPVYICLSGHGIVNNEISGGSGSGSIVPTPTPSVEYTGGDSEYISVAVNGDVITATLKQNGIDLFNKIIAVENGLGELSETVGSHYQEFSAEKVRIDAIDQLATDAQTLAESAKTTANEAKAAADEAKTKIDAIDTEAIQGAINEVASMRSELNDISSNVQGALDAATEAKAVADATGDVVNSLSGQFSSLSGEFASLKSTVDELDLSGIQSAIDELQDNVNDTLVPAVNDLNNLVNKKADVSQVDSAFNRINEVEAKADSAKENADKIVEVLPIVTELQSTAVTQNQVNNIVSSEVNKVFQSEVADGKIKELIIDSLEDEEDNEIKTAVEGIIGDIVVFTRCWSQDSCTTSD